MATFHVSPVLQKFTNGEKKVQVQASDLLGAIDELEKKYPGVKEKILSRKGEVLRFVNIFVDDTDIRNLEMLKTTLTKTSKITLLVAMAGG